MIIWGVHSIGSYIGGWSLWGTTGRTDRVDFDFDDTQVRKYPLGNNEWEVIPDPWFPADQANRLHTHMSGWFDQDPQEFKALMEEVSSMGQDRARWLHNYWLDEIDEKETLFRWIQDESVNDLNWITVDIDWDGSVREAKENAMRALTRWGVGW